MLSEFINEVSAVLAHLERQQEDVLYDLWDPLLLPQRFLPQITPIFTKYRVVQEFRHYQESELPIPF